VLVVEGSRSLLSCIWNKGHPSNLPSLYKVEAPARLYDFFYIVNFLTGGVEPFGIKPVYW
jgi:hypothetical protein